MNFEQFEKGKSVDRIIDEVQEDLERGFYEKADRDEAIAKLETARITAPPKKQLAIDTLLAIIEKKYGND